jgi:hypothetical protein
VPTAVAHNGEFWILVQDVADIAASEPSRNNADWLPYTTAEIVVTPVGISPVDTSVEELLPTLVASSYQNIYSADLRLHREWEVYEGGVLVYSASENANEHTLTEELTLNTEYTWRCRDVAASGAESAWSQMYAFSTAAEAFRKLFISSNDTSANSSIKRIIGMDQDYDVFTQNDTLIDLPVDAAVLRGIDISDDDSYMSVLYGASLWAMKLKIYKLVNNRYEMLPFDSGTDSFADSGIWSITTTFSPNADYLAAAIFVGDPTRVALQVYKRTNDDFVKLPLLSGVPTNITSIGGLIFSRTGKYLVALYDGWSGGTAPLPSVYERDGDVFTKLPDLTPYGATHVRPYSCDFTPDDGYMVLATNSDTILYKIENNVFTIVQTIAQQTVNVRVSDDGNYVMVLVAGRVRIYKRNGEVLTMIYEGSNLGNNILRSDISKYSKYFAYTHSSQGLFVVKRINDTEWMGATINRTNNILVHTPRFTHNVGNDSIKTPTLTVIGSPNDVPETPPLQTSAFDYIGIFNHLNTDWQVLDESSSVVWQSLADAVNLTSIVVPSGVLQTDSTYTFRARHRSAEGLESAWAQVVASTPLTFDVILKSLYVSIFNWNQIATLVDFKQDVDTFTDEGVLINTGNERWFDFSISNDDNYLALITREGSASAGQLRIYKRYGTSWVQLPFDSTGDDFWSYNYNGWYGLDHGISFLGTDYLIATLNGVLPNIQVYKRDGDDWNKLTIIGDTPPFVTEPVTIGCSPNGLYVATLWEGFIGGTQYPNATIYKRDGDVFSKVIDLFPPNPETYEWPRNICFSDTHCALINDFRVSLYEIGNDAFTKVDEVVFDLASSDGTDVAFSRNGNHIFLLTRSYAKIYKVFNNTLVLVYESDEALWQNQYVNVTISPDGNYFAYVDEDVGQVVVIKRIDDDTFSRLPNIAVANMWAVRPRFTNTGYLQV